MRALLFNRLSVAAIGACASSVAADSITGMVHTARLIAYDIVVAI